MARILETRINNKVEKEPPLNVTDVTGVTEKGPTPPPEISKLIESENLAERGLGKSLTQTEKVQLSAWRKFPDDKDIKYRKLQEKELLGPPFYDGPNAGPELTASESADLHSKIRFPADQDIRYRKLLEKDLLAPPVNNGPNAGPKLTASESAELNSKIQFPYDKDIRYRKLAEKELLAPPFNYGPDAGPRLSPEEDELLANRRQGKDTEESQSTVSFFDWIFGKSVPEITLTGKQGSSRAAK
ncbi:MAG TPA: hypothetical protein V6C86_05465 [Oculatellaceae cyanobacterium]